MFLKTYYYQLECFYNLQVHFFQARKTINAAETTKTISIFEDEKPKIFSYSYRCE